ncbi:ribosome small subunit-dependent GTPase A [Pontibacillus yanchengensis]|uniref:Ribosome small subunit-dependent GTPase A n=2 Tax=Pontibacillus yanchengensis TaxID=462910 RepID=A0ACC7VBM6_9BACI|nr:ribosome small subunit-dependent GTPase A [Pontibacillus yanchengensis]MYL33095.1 ribosome small subunit-dependent GTPase A [Pontibacillus yanchengensis]MYL52055.1 ribosome small subunit-dependent GTPase A [Pontibacillus yanchengensis]
MPTGKIIKSLSGFYYVQSEGNVFPCKGRGNFRKKKITPLVGDNVEFDIDENEEGYILEIHKRKNEFVRPPIANIDQAIIVASVVEPDFKPLLLDRFLVLIESKSLQPVIVFTKTDLLDDEIKQEIEQYKKDYEALGYQVVMGSSKIEHSLEEVSTFLEDKTSVIAGQSGVGKSSMLNALEPNLHLETNQISKSLGRGKHTTRHVELIEMYGGLVADTPGFSALEFQDLELDELPDCFPELREFGEECKFRGCLHNKEPKCAVKQAVEDGDIPRFRYEDYLHFLHEIQNRKPRY